VRYVQWLIELFQGLKLPDTTVGQTLDCLRTGILAALSDPVPPEILATLDAARQEAQRLLPGLALGREPPAVPVPAPAAPEPAGATATGGEGGGTETVDEYLGFLLQGNRAAATDLVLRLVENGMDLRSVYLDVFQESQYRLGKLWLGGKISVAQEHFCTAATQVIMSRLYPYVFSTAKNGKKLVAASAGGELHEMGIRIVADIFELEGWDAYYLGANSPAGAIVAALKERQADLLCVSATMTFHLGAVEEIIGAVRAAFGAGSPKILVGGYVFKTGGTLWQKVGADGYAADALGAVRAAEGLLATEQSRLA